MSKLPFIIAVDFDGTLCVDAYPEIGEPNLGLIDGLIELRQRNQDLRIILWTCRDDNDAVGLRLTKAVEFCRKRGLEFDAVNDNIPEVIELYNNNARKIFANYYLDDKGVACGPAISGLITEFALREVLGNA